MNLTFHTLYKKPVRIMHNRNSDAFKVYGDVYPLPPPPPPPPPPLPQRLFLLLFSFFFFFCNMNSFCALPTSSVRIFSQLLSGDSRSIKKVMFGAEISRNQL